MIIYADYFLLFSRAFEFNLFNSLIFIGCFYTKKNKALYLSLIKQFYHFKSPLPAHFITFIISCNFFQFPIIFS
jgi:hypothetical protein